MFWNWSWPARILSVVFLGIVTAILYPAFVRPRESGCHGPSCLSNLKQLGIGLLQYTQDYDDKLPSVFGNRASFGWADAMFPYVKSNSLFQCPQQREDGQTDPKQSGFTDYWFNAQLSKREVATAGDTASLLVMGDGNDGTDVTDARYSISGLPPKWINDPKSPLYRHLEMANYLYLDGHAKWHKPTEISTNSDGAKSGFQPAKVAQ